MKKIKLPTTCVCQRFQSDKDSLGGSRPPKVSFGVENKVDCKGQAKKKKKKGLQFFKLKGWMLSHDLFII